MIELLFNSWWLPVLIVLVGVAVWVGGNKRTESRVRWTGLAIAFVGVGLLVTSLFYETPKKKVTRLSKELVKSVVDQDWNKLQSLLDPHVNLSVTGAPTPIRYRSRDEIVAGAKEATNRYGLHDAGAGVDDVRSEGEMITSTLTVTATVAFTGDHPFPSTWQLDWEKDEAGNWTVHDIRCLQIGNVRAGDAAQYIPQAR